MYITAVLSAYNALKPLALRAAYSLLYAQAVMAWVGYVYTSVWGAKAMRIAVPDARVHKVGVETEIGLCLSRSGWKAAMAHTVC